MGQMAKGVQSEELELYGFWTIFTIDKLRKNTPLNTTTINDLCRILGCPVEQILMYIPSDDDQIL